VEVWAMATQLELFHSPQVVRLRLVAQSIWKNRWFGWVMIDAFSLWYAWWCFNLPSPAKAATVLAVIAAIMAYRGEPEGFEKLFWTLVLFAFLFVELRAIDYKEFLDKQTQAITKAAEDKQFTDIGTGITSGVQGIMAQNSLQFQHTVAQQSQQFDATMKKVQVNINEVTGGNSYAIVYPDFTPTSKNAFPLMVEVCFKCKYSIPSAHISIERGPTAAYAGPSIYTGNVDSHFALNIGNPISPSLVGESVYTISVFARQAHARNAKGEIQ
jgi:hypothetical protein